MEALAEDTHTTTYWRVVTTFYSKVGLAAESSLEICESMPLLKYPSN